MATRNRVELKALIRFQLAQLSARNAHHDFEHLAFELAKLRIASNFMPATGPVSSGGDQGRDFETFRSFLARSRIASSSFVANVSEGTVVGACTLDKRTSTKIKSDLKTIFSSSDKPGAIVYFCERDLPVAQRHELKDLCKTEYQASLEIFDGQSISDLLAAPDTFWIAEQFLSLPSDAWPEEELDGEYSSVRKRWIEDQRSPQNFADFLEIKRGLRIATFEEKAKRDIGLWLSAMSNFLESGGSDRVAQKARYEICVAELRGRGSFDPVLPLAKKFFASVSSVSLPSDLMDAAVLTVYAWGAIKQKQASFGKKIVVEWGRKVRNSIELALKDNPTKGERCSLLEALAVMAVVGASDDLDGDAFADRLLDPWHVVIGEIAETPLYPVFEIAEVLQRLTPVVGTYEKFRSLTLVVDDLIAKRSGMKTAADLARRRAIAHIDAGNFVAGIDELQRAKVGWFTGDTLDESILSMLVISDCYESLNLHYAARYYAAGALFVAIKQDNEHLLRRIGQASVKLADTFYSAGEGVTYIHAVGQALTLHNSVAESAGDWNKHSYVGRMVAHATILRAVAQKLAPNTLPFIDDAFNAWPLPKKEIAELIAMSDRSSWSSTPIPEIESQIDAEIGQFLLADVGERRTIVWSALGIEWTVSGSSNLEDWLAVQEVAASLQIAQVEFADVDLLIVRSNVFLDVAVSDVKTPQLLQLPDNGKAALEADRANC
jgi:hypothetical protein